MATAGAFSVSTSLHSSLITHHSSLPQTDVRELVPGVPIERELAGGEVHAYRITLAAGQYLHVVVDQRGIDVVVTVFGPDGQQLAEMDTPGHAQGPEPVSVVAEASGEYRLEVQALNKEDAPGRYKVRIQEQRAATPHDTDRMAAERALVEGTHQYRQGTAKSLTAAIEKLQEALRLWRAIGDRTGEVHALASIGETYFVMGEKAKALEYFEQVLPFCQALGDRYEEARMLNNVGATYYWLG
jgi:hypothetical protein